MSTIVISGKTLGELGLPTFCPRCFWLKIHCENKLPFQIFPGIFSSIDSYTKKVTNLHYEKVSSVPGWLTGLGKIVKPVQAPHFTKFFVVDKKTDIHLRGVPDEVFQMKDGSYFIVDYKTARYTGTQDELLPMYEIQLNSYAYIGNRGQFNPVSGIGLIYYEPFTDLDTATIADFLMKDGFQMAFKSSVHPVKLDPDGTIPPLLKRVRKIVDMQKAPRGAAGCKDCEKLDRLIKLATS